MSSSGRTAQVAPDEAVSARRRWLPAIVLFAVALTVRLAHLLTMRDSVYFQFPIMDGLIHDQWAWALASGGEIPWPPPFFRAPLYPYFLALVYSAFGHSYAAARGVQMVLGSLSVVLVYLLGRRVFGAPAAWIAGLVAAFYWTFLYFEGELLIVPLIVVLDLAALLLLVRATDGPRGRALILPGLVLGLSAIARPNVLLFAAGVPLWLLLARPRSSPSATLRAIAFFVLGVVLPILPVTAANWASGDRVLIASQGGVNFYIGNNPDSDGTQAVVPGTRTDWWGGYEDTIVLAEEAMGRALKPSEVSRYWYDRGLDFIRTRPGSALRLFLRKLHLFWNHLEVGNNRDLYFVQARSPVLRILSPVGFGVIAPLGLVGMGLAWRRSRQARLLILFVLLYMISVLLFFVNARYRMPVVPVLILFAGFGVSTFIDQIRSRSWAQLAGLAVPVVLFALLVHSDLHGLAKDNPAFGHYNLGLIYREAGDLDRAVEELTAAVRADPLRREARYTLAVSLLEAGRHAEAQRELLELVSREPDDAEAHYALGTAWTALGNLEDAARAFQRATALRPHYAEAHHGLGVVRYRQGLLDMAERCFRTAIEINPDFAAAYNNLGIVRVRQGDSTGAREMFRRALEIDPEHAGARGNLARLPAD